MGQKTNPNIFRLSRTDNWNSKYIEKKSNEFYLYPAKDLEVRKFIAKFLKKNGLSVHKLKLNYLNNNLNIFVSYAQNCNSISAISNLNKAQKIKFWRNSFVKKKVLKMYSRIKTSIKNSHNYEIINYKKNFDLADSQVLKKLHRIQILKHYKRYLSLKKNKSIKNLITNEFLKKLFESLQEFFDGKLFNIAIILKPLNRVIGKTLKKKQRGLLKKRLIKLKKYQRQKFFKDGVNLMFLALTNQNSANLLSDYIAMNLQKLKRHNFFLKFVLTILKMFINKMFYSVIKGIKIKIKGRINGAPRAKLKTIKIGQHMPVLTLDSKISYSESRAYTSNGTIGVKVWLCENET